MRLFISAKSLFISYILLSFFQRNCLSFSTSAKDKVPLGKRLQRTPVEYIIPDVEGDEYCRPVGKSQQATAHRALSSQVDVHSMSSVSLTCEQEQQVHITLGNNLNSIIVSFISKNSSTRSRIAYSLNHESLQSSSTSSSPSAAILHATNPQGPQTYSQLLYVSDYLISPPMGSPSETNEYVNSLQDTSSWAYDNLTHEHWTNYQLQQEGSTASMGFGLYSNPYMYYDSPFVHTVTLNDLQQAVTYYYQPEGSCKIFHFTLPQTSTTKNGGVVENTYPFTIGMVVDLGQTLISNASITALIAMDPDAVLLAGDLSYADGWAPLWDSFGELFEPLGAHVPVLTTGGNHEFASGEAWQSYSARYLTPYLQSGSGNFNTWGREIGGGVHVIALNSYAGFFASSPQYKWLANYLKTRVDRIRTPWLIVMMHVPMYNTNVGHWREGELFRRSIEPLLYEYGVDVVLTGHVHSYERTHEVYDNKVNPCGFVHLTVGDGGNYEGAYVPWRDLSTGTDGAWSAFREASFGVAEVKVMSDTEIQFAWHRHACQSAYSTNYGQNFSDACVTIGDNSAQKMMLVDPTNITKPSKQQCPNRWKSSDSLNKEQILSTNKQQPSVDNNILSDKNIIKLLSIFVLLSLLCYGILLILLIIEIQKNQAASASMNGACVGVNNNRNTSQNDHLSLSISTHHRDSIEDSNESSNPLLPPSSLLFSPSSLNIVSLATDNTKPATNDTTTTKITVTTATKNNSLYEPEYTEVENGLTNTNHNNNSSHSHRSKLNKNY